MDQNQNSSKISETKTINKNKLLETAPLRKFEDENMYVFESIEPEVLEIITERKFQAPEDENICDKNNSRSLFRKKLKQSANYVNFILGFYKKYINNKVKLDFSTNESLDELANKFGKIECEVQGHTEYNNLYEEYKNEIIDSFSETHSYHILNTSLKRKLKIDFREERRVLQAYNSLRHTRNKITLDYKNDSLENLVIKFCKIKKAIGEPIDHNEFFIKKRSCSFLETTAEKKTLSHRKREIRKLFDMSLEEFNERSKNYIIVKNDKILDASEVISPESVSNNFPELTEEVEPKINIFANHTKNWVENMSIFFDESKIFNTEWNVFKDEKDSILEKISNNKWIISNKESSKVKSEESLGDVLDNECSDHHEYEFVGVYNDEHSDSDENTETISSPNDLKTVDLSEDPKKNSINQEDEFSSNETDVPKTRSTTNKNQIKKKHFGSKADSSVEEDETSSNEKDVPKTNKNAKKKQRFGSNADLSFELLKTIKKILKREPNIKIQENLENISEIIKTTIYTMDSTFKKIRTRILTSSDQRLLKKIRCLYIPEDIPADVLLIESLKPKMSRSQHMQLRKTHKKLDAFKNTLINKDPEFDINLISDKTILKILRTSVANTILIRRRNKEYFKKK